MKIIYFFHCVLDQNIERITNTINVYFSRTNYSFYVNDHFSFYAYKRQGLRFFWRVDPIELNFEDMGLQSEVVLKGQTVGKKEITEIRISFTDDPILEHYFEGLVYYLLNQFEIINGTRQIPCLEGKLRFTSLYDYNLYRRKQERDSQEELERAFSQNNFEESQSPSNVESVDLELSNTMKIKTDYSNNSANHDEGQNDIISMKLEKNVIDKCPKREKILKAHKQAMQAMDTYDKHQRDLYKNSETDKIKQTPLEVYRDVITDKLKKTYSVRQISRIREEAELGCFN